MAKASITGLTGGMCRDHIAESGYRNELSCPKILGFHLQKLQTGGSWRFRYLDFNNKKRLINLGKYTNDTANRLDAAEQASKYCQMLRDGIDPLAEKENKQEAYRQAETKKQASLLQLYLDGIYTQHQKRKTGEGKHTLDMIKKHFVDYLDKPMQDLSVADLKSWQAQKEQSGLTHATIKRAFGALRTMLRHAVREHVLESDPSSNFQLIPPTAIEKTQNSQGDELKNRRMLTNDELKKINIGLSAYKEKLIQQRLNSRTHGKANLPDLSTQHFPHWFIPFFHLARYTGLRTGDLYSLNWQELNLQFKRLVKVPNKTRHHAEPIKVDLPLNEDILNIMQAWHEQQGKPESGLVFPSPVSGNKMDKKAHITHWKQVLKLGGIKSTLDFYALRHHYISVMVAGRVAMFAVARLAGHKSVKMIEQHYGHLAPHAASDALAMVARGFIGSHEINNRKGVV